MKKKKTVTEATCDVCNKEFTKLEEKMDYSMKLYGNYVENNTPTGVSYMSGEYDLCSSCYNKITQRIQDIRDNKDDA